MYTKYVAASVGQLLVEQLLVGKLLAGQLLHSWTAASWAATVYKGLANECTMGGEQW